MKYAGNMPLVSVIIPVYNSDKFLEETLLSVLSSTYPNVEIVIVDDGSTDDSPAIAARYAGQYDHIHFLQQANAGTSVARNRAIEAATGEYILPVDSDDRISAEYISLAVEAIRGDGVKLVYSEAEFFGDRTGAFRLPPFSIRLLARRNIIHTCGMYRREDWVRAGGYIAHVGREDWVFWIALLKDGGKVVRLKHTGFYYRIRAGSKRTEDRAMQNHTIDMLNGLYPDFFLRELKGPLHYRRTWSRLINTCRGWLFARRIVLHPDCKELESFMSGLPAMFGSRGETMYRGRNELRLFRRDGYELVVKSYRRPQIPNAVAYGFLRPSKAERAYRHALRLLADGIGTPAPVGFMTCRRWFLLADSYSVSLRSACPFTYRDFATRSFPRRDEILEAIARTTARMHECGILHKDYSAGNILFDDAPDTIPVEIVDLNRMSFGKVGLTKGCRNFERLPATTAMKAVMAACYARERNFDVRTCTAKMRFGKEE
ncbi:MAG: glycosyltransferase [Tannerella sp.]|jgi:glycosyltransferase involved in cell wall biosynthesis|nr:glycosyltransferase [Tannerella sp.]